MMAGDNYDRSTRSKAEQEERINRVIEKVLTNKTFLEKMLNAVHDALSSRDQKIKELEDRIELQEQYSRSNNLCIFGVPESQAEKVEDVIVKICSDKLNLNISTADIDCCHRLKGKEGTHRPIIVRFCRRSIRNDVYRAKNKLKGTKTVIREDLTKARISVVKSLINKTSYRDVFTNNGNIFVKIRGNICKIKSISDYNNIIDKHFNVA